MIRRLLATTAILVASSLVAAAPASAQYEGPCGFVLESSTVALDGQVAVFGAGFAPGSTVTFEINGVFLGTTVVGPDDDGPVDAIFDLPTGLPDGEYLITTTCDGNIVSQSVIVGNPGLICGFDIFTGGTTANLRIPGFEPNTPITIVLDPGQFALYSGPATGNPMTLTVNMPANLAGGEYLIVATGTDILGQPKTLSCPVQAQVTTPPAPQLPVTGSEATMLLVRVGLVLVTLGGVLFVATRRRSIA